MAIDKQRYKKKAAFTLIELLVVVSIIALLVSILLPALSKARTQAQKIVCLTNLKSIGLGIIQYAEDNNNWIPPCDYRDQASSNRYYWLWLLAPYVGIDQDEINYWGTPKSGKGYEGALAVYHCPRKERPATNVYYGINTWGLTAHHMLGITVKLDRVPPRAITIADADQFSIWDPKFCDFNYDGGVSSPAMGPPHGIGYNYLFGDGRAEWLICSEPYQWINHNLW